jgi:hypothetical protein
MEFDLRKDGQLTLNDGLDMLKAMEEYAHENYEAWGHWAVETWEATRYLACLRATGWNLDRAKDDMREHCLLLQECQ